jgi:AcrR family transcriptional regulator
MAASEDSTPRTARRVRGRPRGGNPAETRERVLRAAARLFAQHGYRVTSMAGIAEAAGLSQTGLVHHFPSKEQLLAAVLERRDRTDFETLVKQHGDEPEGWEVFDRLTHVVEVNATREGMVRLFTAMVGEAIDAEHPGHDWLRSHHGDVIHRLGTALQDAVENGTARPDTPVHQIARLTVALMDGLQIQWLLNPEDVDMAADFTAFVSGIRTRWELPKD